MTQAKLRQMSYESIPVTSFQDIHFHLLLELPSVLSNLRMN